MKNSQRYKKVIFLDRDGVINKFPGRGKYVRSLAEFKLIKGSLAAIKKLSGANFDIFVISNQAGVAKGLYSRLALHKMTARMLKEAKDAGGKITKVLYCLHRQEDDCTCRKPKLGLIKKALAGLKAKIDCKNSYLVGDDIKRDIKMGKISRLKTILVLTGRERLKEKNSWVCQPDYIFKNLLAASRFILKRST